MKIVITESQYSALTRRYSSFVPLDELVDLFIAFLDPRNYETFDLFYIKLKEHTTDRIIRDMLRKDMLDTTNRIIITQEVLVLPVCMKLMID